ncbi:SMI1/KNR4 family protein [Luteolibacter flavescens]|uniref:SMI1/KNR4 family protein n=1 Tax=Luteolibacter flavescens TaxID=1859460 RepID=A0ABT3FMH9_9BACT|nr:SMI1/KNR4 family protein [Luteolibacter flavescens]MCW1884662.1 SMI1/KNR4 family protein [Luteolibacter flavescens]
MTSDILEAKKLIDRLRAADPEFLVFGARSHRYEIGPPLSEPELSSFEERYGITLPEDFRLYLSLVGNGNESKPGPRATPHRTAGAGPGYGIHTLSETVIGDQTCVPFPYSQEVEVPIDEAGDDVPGALEICTLGCGSHVNLIVAGSEFGKVWKGNEYLHFSPTHLNFASWITEWAEGALSLLAKRELVQKLSLGMTKAQVVDVIGGEWTVRKSGRWWFFEGPTIPARIALSEENGVVSSIDPWPFI